MRNGQRGSDKSDATNPDVANGLCVRQTCLRARVKRPTYFAPYWRQILRRVPPDNEIDELDKGCGACPETEQETANIPSYNCRGQSETRRGNQATDLEFANTREQEI